MWAPIALGWPLSGGTCALKCHLLICQPVEDHLGADVHIHHGRHRHAHAKAVQQLRPHLTLLHHQVGRCHDEINSKPSLDLSLSAAWPQPILAMVPHNKEGQA